jgi:hypothetical protein
VERDLEGTEWVTDALREGVNEPVGVMEGVADDVAVGPLLVSDNSDDSVHESVIASVDVVEGIGCDPV